MKKLLILLVICDEEIINIILVIFDKEIINIMLVMCDEGHYYYVCYV